MNVKVAFSERDVVLAAIIRALAFKAAGRPTARGKTEEVLLRNEFYQFEFSPHQLEKFKGFISDYLPERWSKTIHISEISN